MLPRISPASLDDVFPLFFLFHWIKTEKIKKIREIDRTRQEQEKTYMMKKE